MNHGSSSVTQTQNWRHKFYAHSCFRNFPKFCLFY